MSTLTPAAPFVPDYASYDAADVRPEFVADMTRQSPFERRFPRGIAVLHYDPAVYDFRAFVREALTAAGMVEPGAFAANGGRLEHLHELLRPECQAMDQSQQCAAARVLYELPAAFHALHARFLAEVVIPALGLGPAHHQMVPNFRVFCPHAPGYPGRTSFHSDIMIGHNPREVNVFVPLVRCAETRSLLFAELQPSLELLRNYDYDFARFGRDSQQDQAAIARLEAMCRPLELEVGDVVLFDSRCVHAGPHNTTPLTRVTFDTRLLPAADAASQHNAYRGLGRRRAAFVPGGYFSPAPIGR